MDSNHRSLARKSRFFYAEGEIAGTERGSQKVCLVCGTDGSNPSPSRRPAHSGDKSVEIDRGQGHWLLPREGEELCSEACPALSGRTCGGEKARQGLIASAEPRSEHFEVAENRYQQVIEIVRAPASKLTNRLHLLCLMKLILDLPHFRDVTRSSDNKRVTLLPCCR